MLVSIPLVRGYPRGACAAVDEPCDLSPPGGGAGPAHRMPDWSTVGRPQMLTG